MIIYRSVLWNSIKNVACASDRNEARLDKNKPKYGYSSEIFHLYYFQK